MKRSIKIGFIFVLMLLLGLVGSLSVVSATTGTKYYCDNTAYWYQPSTETTKDVYGVTYTHTQGQTNDGCYQNISVFSMKTDGKTSKLVSWSPYNSTDGYNRAPLTEIAADYETKHPGWIVAAGINSDQYYTATGTGLGTNGHDNYAPQPYYPNGQDGERTFPITPYGNSTGQYVGFSNDGATDGLVDPSTLAGCYVEVLDDNGNITNEFLVNGFNQEPTGDGITVWTALTTGATSAVVGQRVNYTFSYETKVVKDNTGVLYLVEKPDMAYMNNSTAWDSVKKPYSGVGIDSFFGKGKVSRLSHAATLNTNAFVIDTASTAFKEAVSTGTYVRVQFRYNSEALNACESISGYHTVQVANGVDNTGAANDYNNRNYPRSVFGQTADGTYVLIEADGAATGHTNTVDGHVISGLTWGQIDAVCDEFGVVEAYQDDGGGSAEAIVRNEQGKIVCCSSPSEGVERYNMSALLFVVKDPSYNLIEFDVDMIKLESTHVELMIDEYSLYKTKADALRIDLNGVSYTASEDGIFSFDGLTHNTEYKMTLYYTVGETEYSQELSFTTAKLAPTLYGIDLQERDGKTIVTVKVSDIDKALTGIKVRVNNTLMDYTEPITLDSYDGKSLRCILTYKLYDEADSQSVTIMNAQMGGYNALTNFIKQFDELIDEILNK